MDIWEGWNRFYSLLSQMLDLDGFSALWIFGKGGRDFIPCSLRCYSHLLVCPEGRKGNIPVASQGCGITEGPAGMVIPQSEGILGAPRTFPQTLFNIPIFHSPTNQREPAGSGGSELLLPRSPALGGIPQLPGVLRGAWWVLLAWENLSWKQSVGRGRRGSRG